ncbi:MAG: exodeoxyribonuclease VII large subunit, partial [Ilumatobacter sp.]
AARSAARLVRLSHHAAEAADRRLGDLERRRGLLDPARLLERGWSITTDGDGRVVRSVADVSGGSELRTRLADGVALSTVSEVVSDD